MPDATRERIREGINEAKWGNTYLGRTLLENFVENVTVPEAKAWFGYCVAHEDKNFLSAIKLCREVIKENPRLADGYLAMSRVYLLLGLRKQAIEILQKGENSAGNQEIVQLLKRLGIRRPQIFHYFSRDNFFNVTVGRLLGRIGLR